MKTVSTGHYVSYGFDRVEARDEGSEQQILTVVVPPNLVILDIARLQASETGLHVSRHSGLHVATHS